MPAGPLLYRAAPKWQVLAAFGAAFALHALAVGIAALRPEEPIVDVMPDLENIAEVTFEQAPPAPPEPTPPPEEEEPEPLDAPPEPLDKPEFVEEKPTPPPKPKTDKPKAVAPIARPQAPASVAGPMSMSSAKAVAISAPRPEYPYEARRARATGSGVCVMTVDPSSGVSNERGDGAKHRQSDSGQCGYERVPPLALQTGHRLKGENAHHIYDDGGAVLTRRETQYESAFPDSEEARAN